MPRDLIDLGLVARLTETTQHLTSRYVKRHGPDPVGRIGNSPFWNAEDLDALITAVEVGKSRNKNKALVIVVPDEKDALASRIFVRRADRDDPVYLRDGDGEEVKTLDDFVQYLGLDEQMVQNLRDLCAGDEVKVANNLADLLRSVGGFFDGAEDTTGV